MQVPVEVEKIVYTSCEDDPVSNRSKDWGRPGYTHCDQPYSWRQLVYGYKNNKVSIKSGGLGKLIELGGYQTWVCIKHHFCGDPYFCWVYHETSKVFTPWGTNAKLQLVKSWGCEASVLALSYFTYYINLYTVISCSLYGIQYGFSIKQGT